MTSHPIYQYCKFTTSPECVLLKLYPLVTCPVLSPACQTWRGHRMGVWECLSGTDLSSSFALDKQATLELLGSTSTPKAIRYTLAHTLHATPVFCLFSAAVTASCSCSVESQTERASLVSGRSTRHPPTLSPTWWGHLHILYKINRINSLTRACVLILRVGSAIRRPVGILLSSHPPASLLLPASPLITGMCSENPPPPRTSTVLFLWNN